MKVKKVIEVLRKIKEWKFKNYKSGYLLYLNISPVNENVKEVLFFTNI